ncbi:STAS domain-containing protein [Spirillospora sp. NPDC050679]
MDTFTASSDVRGDFTVVEFVGALDFASMEQARRPLRAALEAGQRWLIVDMARLDFLDSSGLGLMVWAQRQADHHDAWLAWVGLRAPLMRRVRVTGLARVLSLHPSVQAAQQAARIDGPDGGL